MEERADKRSSSSPSHEQLYPGWAISDCRMGPTPAAADLEVSLFHPEGLSAFWA